MNRFFIKNSIKTLSGILIAFICVEILLRLLGYPSVNTNTFDKDNLVIFKPNQEFLVKDRCYENTLVTNDKGFHSVTYSQAKPQGVFRIVVLGDSFVEAVQIPYEDTFPALLEKKLNERGGNVKYEVIPIAKSGNGTLANILYGEKYALDYNPDLIIDSFISNDLSDDYAAQNTLHATGDSSVFDPKSLYLSPSQENPKLLFIKHVLLERSRLFERLWMNALVIKNQLKQGKPVEKSDKPFIDPFIFAQIDPSDAHVKDMWAVQEKALRTMNAFVSDNKAKFLLLHLAEGYLIDTNVLKSRFGVSSENLARFNSNELRDTLTRISGINNFSFFSTQSDFAKNYKNSEKLPIFSCDNHYNKLGHEWTADALYNYLMGEGKSLIK